METSNLKRLFISFFLLFLHISRKKSPQVWKKSPQVWKKSPQVWKKSPHCYMYIYCIFVVYIHH